MTGTQAEGKFLTPEKASSPVGEFSFRDGVAPAAAVPQAGKIQLGGDTSVRETYARLLDTFDPNFNIVIP
jgi:Alkyl sulfatase C-terminal